MKLTDKQIKKLEFCFLNYPENFKNHRYGTMQGIKEQLNELGDKVGFIFYCENAKLEDNEKYYVEMGKFVVNIK